MADFRSNIALYVLCFSISAFGATYTGRVVDDGTSPKPIANATVTIMSVPVSVYTDSNGMFTLSYTTGINSSTDCPHHSNLHFNNGHLSFSCQQLQLVRLDLYSLDGRKTVNLLERHFVSGRYAISLPSLIPSTIVPGIYLVTASMENRRSTTTLFLTNTIKGFGRSSGYTAMQGTSRRAQIKSAAESVILQKQGFEPVTKVCSEGDAPIIDLGTIVLSRTAKEAAIAHKADSILALMTIDEKAGQMVQTQINFTNSHPGRFTDDEIAALCIGSVFNGGSDESASGQPNTPDAWSAAIDRTQRAVLTSSRLKIPIIYGQDCVHGAGEIEGCTLFPHNIGLGCTGDSALVANIGRITAQECTGIGVRLNYAPCIAAARNERWGRTYESFGETPEINMLMGAAYIRGLQGDGVMDKIGAMAACAKHFLGDGGTNDGENNGETSISDATMRAIHLPPYAAATRELVASVMPSYHTWIHQGGSWKQTLDKYSQTTILKTELGFDGFCLSDWDAIPRGCDSYKLDCVAQAINAGLDMAMIVGNSGCEEFIASIKEGVENQTIPISRIDDAVRRILRIKLRFGLFENPYSDAGCRGRINSPEHKAVARESVRKSLVLLKNEGNALPLNKNDHVAVVGPWANSLGAQCGGWTISWQGSVDHGGLAGQTILKGLQELGGSVTFSEDGSNISDADKIVIVIGENPYAEQFGDCLVPDLSECPHADLIGKCSNSNKPVILVIISGRPMIIDTEINQCQAVVAAWLPGSEGGGVADVLFGDSDFTGHLTHTWPSSGSQIPLNTEPEYPDEQKGSGGTPLFPYGFGLHYNQ